METNLDSIEKIDAARAILKDAGIVLPGYELMREMIDKLQAENAHLTSELSQR